MTWLEGLGIQIPHIYFVYGLAFFTLGLTVALEIGRTEPTRFSRAMRPLAVFGLVHGSHEWIEMFAIIEVKMYGVQPSAWFEGARLVLLSVSFVSLIAFGVQMLRPPKRLPFPDLWIGLGILLLYGMGVMWVGRWLAWQRPGWFAAADALARYSLGIPGAGLAAGVLLAQRQTFLRSKQPAFANDLLWAALAFILYGFLGQLFVGASPLFPSTFLNAQTFQRWFGVPVQLFRAIMAGVMAVFIIRALRSFEFNRQQTLAAARRRVEEEIARRNLLRQELLRRMVEMQEEERTRIARELHDELGQVLTGLAMGLRGAQISAGDPKLLQCQLGQLEEMAVRALGNMRRLVNELRPALLDDLGLSAALRHHVDNFGQVTGIKTRLTICQDYDRLPSEVETVLFRITQEALTNVARHARATHVWVNLTCDKDSAILQVEDDGLGFDPATVFDGKEQIGWGLMGIQERVKSVGGTVQIQSTPGKGARLVVCVPLKMGGKDHATHPIGVG